MSNFVFYNPNPNQKYKKDGTPMRWHGTDCTVRSLAKVLNCTWEKSFSILCKTGLELKMTFDDIKVLEKVYKQLGGIRYTFGRTQLPTVNQFVKSHPKGTYIVNISRHVACVKDGKLYDTWDCGPWKVRSYYQFT